MVNAHGLGHGLGVGPYGMFQTGAHPRRIWNAKNKKSTPRWLHSGAYETRYLPDAFWRVIFRARDAAAESCALRSKPAIVPNFGAFRAYRKGDVDLEPCWDRVN